MGKVTTVRSGHWRDGRYVKPHNMTYSAAAQTVASVPVQGQHDVDPLHAGEPDDWSGPYGNVRRHMDDDPTWPHYASDLPEHVEVVVERHAQDVFERHRRWPLDCGEVSATWKQTLEREGIRCSYRSGMFIGGISPQDVEQGAIPESREHVWLVLENGAVFDPTASQFSGKVDSFAPEQYMDDGNMPSSSGEYWHKPGWNTVSFEHESNAFDDMDGGLGEAADYIREAVGWDPDGPAELVDPNELIGSQSWLVEDGVSQYRGVEDHEPVQIVDYQGCRYVWDGHHRVEAALRDGRPVLAEIMTFDW